MGPTWPRNHCALCSVAWLTKTKPNPKKHTQKKHFKKIPRTGDTESLDQCG